MEELEPLKVRTTVIEKAIEDDVSDSKVQPENKKENARKILFENNTEENFAERFKRKSETSSPVNAKFQFEAAKTFFTEEKAKEAEKKEILKEIITEKEVEPELKVYTEEEPEEKIQDLDFTKTEEKAENEEEIKIYKKSNKKVNFKSRLRIMVFGVCAVLACFMGWSIYNAVEIEILKAELETANKTYAVNIVNYINNISKADDLTSDSLINLNDLADAGLPVIPGELENPTAYSVRSNWFDRFCNWLSGLFS